VHGNAVPGFGDSRSDNKGGRSNEDSKEERAHGLLRIAAKGKGYDSPAPYQTLPKSTKTSCRERGIGLWQTGFETSRGVTRARQSFCCLI